MKKVLAASLPVLLLLLTHTRASQSQTTEAAPFPFNVTIKPEIETAKSGSKVIIDVALTNATNDTVIGPPIEIEEMKFAVDVLQAQGGQATLTERGKVWHHQTGWSGGGPVFPMKPGETAHRKIVVSELYEMTDPGKYTIQLRRAGVLSNKITIEIAP